MANQTAPDARGRLVSRGLGTQRYVGAVQTRPFMSLWDRCARPVARPSGTARDVHRNLGVIGMRQIAPTLAKILEMDFATARLSAVEYEK